MTHSTYNIGIVMGIVFEHCLCLCRCTCTVEPPNNGHIGDRSLVLCREVVPISEVVPERVRLREISH